MKVVFTTLFLALVVGTHNVRVEIDGEPSRVVFSLDGVQVATDETPPWRARLDFGTELAPHEIEAVAFSADGDQVGRAEQWVNLPRAEAALEIVVGRDDEGRPSSVRLVTASAVGEQPRATHLTLDGEPIDIGSEGQYPLPKLDLVMPHFLRAAAIFPSGELATADLSFGGTYGGEFTTRITAVPVVSRKRPRPSNLDGLILIDGEPARIEAVEKDGAKVFVVADGALSHLLRTIQPSANFRGVAAALVPGRPDPKLDLNVVVRPVPVRSGRGRRATEAFPTTVPLKITSAAPIDWHLTRLNIAEHDTSAQRLADAVAVAGVRAAATQCPRIVLLLLADESPDLSDFSPEEVRRFLDVMHVPLVVLRWGEPLESEPWGEVIAMGDRRNLRPAMVKVRGALNDQWIAWIEGQHPLHRIEVRGDAGVGSSGAESEF